MMGLVGCLAYEFQVSLPYMAEHGLHVGSAGFGFMTASMGAGAVVGGLAVATRGKVGALPLILAAFAFGIAMTLAAIAPSLALELVAVDLACDLPDLRLDGLKLSFGFLAIGLGRGGPVRNLQEKKDDCAAERPRPEK